MHDLDTKGSQLNPQGVAVAPHCKLAGRVSCCLRYSQPRTAGADVHCAARPCAAVGSVACACPSEGVWPCMLCTACSAWPLHAHSADSCTDSVCGHVSPICCQNITFSYCVSIQEWVDGTTGKGLLNPCTAEHSPHLSTHCAAQSCRVLQPG